MMAELQAETARQKQELQFYRGLVVRQYGSGTLRVQELSVRAEEEERRYRVLITLVQAATRDTVANGTVTFAVEGKQGKEPRRCRSRKSRSTSASSSRSRCASSSRSRCRSNCPWISSPSASMWSTSSGAVGSRPSRRSTGAWKAGTQRRFDPPRAGTYNATAAIRSTGAVVSETAQKNEGLVFTDAAARKVGELIREEGNPKLSCACSSPAAAVPGSSTALRSTRRRRRATLGSLTRA